MEREGLMFRECKESGYVEWYNPREYQEGIKVKEEEEEK